MFGLVDCNNFYCSCERVFNPALRTQPVVVLSNNDGCIIARSNALAKVASKYGKKYKGYEGVCLIDTEEKRIKALQGFDIADVWGIGRRSTKKLDYYGVKTAWDFTQWSESRVRRLLTVTGVRTWKELRGENCIDISELPEKQSICTSRSFPDNGLSELKVVEEAVANFAASCVRKLREQKNRCSQLTVFAYTSRFRYDMPSHTINRTVTLPMPTNDQLELVAAAAQALRAEWREDGKYYYKKAGVIVWNITPDTAVQTILFDTIDRDKQARLAASIDAINRRNGFNTVKVAVQGTDKRWHLKSEHKSGQYSTNLSEIIKVKV